MASKEFAYFWDPVEEIGVRTGRETTEEAVDHGMGLRDGVASSLGEEVMIWDPWTHRASEPSLG